MTVGVRRLPDVFEQTDGGSDRGGGGPDALLGFTWLIPIVAGIIPFSRQRTILNIWVSPLVASLWPIFGFTDPINRGFSAVLLGQNTFPTAAHSIGSPTPVPVFTLVSRNPRKQNNQHVPVAWHSTYAVSSKDRFAL